MNFDKFNQVEEGQVFEKEIKEGVDFVYNQHPELMDVGTEKEYSSYLDTIFPDSQEKDILYHGDGRDGEKREFYKKEGELGSRDTVIFFATDRHWAKRWAEDKDDNITSVLVNIKKQFNFDNLSKEEKNELVELNRQNIIKKGLPEDFANKRAGRILIDLKEGFWEVFNEPYLVDFFNKKGYDSWREKEGEGYENLTVFTPEQIHILGSEMDVVKFRDFLNEINKN
jgi:hypothetical protein